MLARLYPMRLLRIPEPFDDPDFLFEPKLDGFRALAHIEGHRCSLISRNDNVFKSWPQLCDALAAVVRYQSAVLDGEICCLDPDGRTNFKSLLFSTGAAVLLRVRSADAEWTRSSGTAAHRAQTAARCDHADG